MDIFSYLNTTVDPVTLASFKPTLTSEPSAVTVVSDMNGALFFHRLSCRHRFASDPH